MSSRVGWRYASSVLNESIELAATKRAVQPPSHQK